METNEHKIMRLLQNGARLGTIDFVRQGFICHPNKAISRLLSRGIPIKSEWVKPKSGNRYKVWWIEPRKEEE